MWKSMVYSEFRPRREIIGYYNMDSLSEYRVVCVLGGVILCPLPCLWTHFQPFFQLCSMSTSSRPWNQPLGSARRWKVGGECCWFLPFTLLLPHTSLHFPWRSALFSTSSSQQGLRSLFLSLDPPFLEAAWLLAVLFFSPLNILYLSP